MTVRQLLLSISMAAAIPGAFAQTTTTSGTRTTKLPLVGLGATETAQITVLNTASTSTGGTAASCTGTIAFLNTAGTVIGAAAAYTVTSDQAFTVKLPFANSGGSGLRTLLIGEVTRTVVSGTPCALTILLETYDTATGATRVELTGSASEGEPNFGH